jgi:nucleoside-diphosphate-sugar epimerase
MNMLILGCGAIGYAVAQQLVQAGHTVTAVTRNPVYIERLREQGIRADCLDLMHDSLHDIVCQNQCVLHCAPPPATGYNDPLTAQIIHQFQTVGHPQRLVYISTTGVYGDCNGAWVDEQWPVQPTASRSWRRVDAERQLQTWADQSGAALVILRVAGIYGPDRLPLERLRSRQPVIRAHEAPWSNRIHADDLVTICQAALLHAPDRAIYNVSDGHPSTMTDYFFALADHFGIARPPQISLADADQHLSPGMLSYLQESRRLSNQKLLTELQLTLRYPTLADGLAALPQ